MLRYIFNLNLRFFVLCIDRDTSHIGDISIVKLEMKSSSLNTILIEYLLPFFELPIVELFQDELLGRLADGFEDTALSSYIALPAVMRHTFLSLIYLLSDF